MVKAWEGKCFELGLEKLKKMATEKAVYLGVQREHRQEINGNMQKKRLLWSPAKLPC